MAYKILSTDTLDTGNKYIKVEKYAILEKDGDYFLQLKLKNISDFIITKFKIKYDIEKEYVVENQSINPGEVFFSKNLIPLENNDFKFIDIYDIKGKKTNENLQQENSISKKTSIDENNLKNYNYLRITAIFLIFFTLWPVLNMFLGYLSITKGLKYSGIGTKILYIVNILGLLGGIFLFILAHIFSKKAKQEGVYDYRGNIKEIIYTLLIILFISFIMIANEYHSQSTNNSILASSSSTKKNTTNNNTTSKNTTNNSTSSSNNGNYRQNDLTILEDLFDFEIPYIDLEYSLQDYSNELGSTSVAIVFYDATYDDYNELREKLDDSFTYDSEGHDEGFSWCYYSYTNYDIVTFFVDTPLCNDYGYEIPFILLNIYDKNLETQDEEDNTPSEGMNRLVNGTFTENDADWLYDKFGFVVPCVGTAYEIIMYPSLENELIDGIKIAFYNYNFDLAYIENFNTGDLNYYLNILDDDFIYNYKIINKTVTYYSFKYNNYEIYVSFPHEKAIEIIIFM